MTTWQQPLDTLPSRAWDAIVIGAGPSGATAALRLARDGHRVLLLDRHRFPRDKACGDALMPDAMRALRRNGLLDRVAALGPRIGDAIVYSPSRIRFRFSGDFMCVKRERLDAELARAAAEAGATCALGKVRRVWQENGSVCVDAGGEAPLRARVAVAATGADVSLLREHGMVAREAQSAVAVRCYVRSAYALDALAFSLDRAIIPGYAWIFPVGEGEYNVGLGVIDRDGRAPTHELRPLLQTFLECFPLARDVMAVASGQTPVRGARLRCGLVGARGTNGGRVLATGETVGATYPFSGEGIGKAMETAELAAEAIHQALAEDRPDRLAEYETRLQRDLAPRYLGYAVAERWLARRWLSDLLARRARRSARIRGAIAGLVDESVDPRSIFSVRGLLLSIFA